MCDGNNRGNSFANLLEPMKKAAAGTDDKSTVCVSEISAIYSAKILPKDCSTLHSIAKMEKKKSVDNELKTAILPQIQLSPVRLERTTSGSGGQRSIQLSYGDLYRYILLPQVHPQVKRITRASQAYWLNVILTCADLPPQLR